MQLLPGCRRWSACRVYVAGVATWPWSPAAARAAAAECHAVAAARPPRHAAPGAAPAAAAAAAAAAAVVVAAAARACACCSCCSCCSCLLLLLLPPPQQLLQAPAASLQVAEAARPPTSWVLRQPDTCSADGDPRRAAAIHVDAGRSTVTRRSGGWPALRCRRPS